MTANRALNFARASLVPWKRIAKIATYRRCNTPNSTSLSREPLQFYCRVFLITESPNSVKLSLSFLLDGTAPIVAAKLSRRKKWEPHSVHSERLETQGTAAEMSARQ